MNEPRITSTRVRVELTTTVKEGYRVGSVTTDITWEGSPGTGEVDYWQRAYLESAIAAGELRARLANQGVTE